MGNAGLSFGRLHSRPDSIVRGGGLHRCLYCPPKRNPPCDSSFHNARTAFPSLCLAQHLRENHVCRYRVRYASALFGDVSVGQGLLAAWIEMVRRSRNQRHLGTHSSGPFVAICENTKSNDPRICSVRTRSCRTACVDFLRNVFFRLPFGLAECTVCGSARGKPLTPHHFAD